MLRGCKKNNVCSAMNFSIDFVYIIVGSRHEKIFYRHTTNARTCTQIRVCLVLAVRTVDSQVRARAAVRMNPTTVFLTTLIMFPTRDEGDLGFSADPVGVGVDVPLLVPTVSLEPVGGISPNLHGYIIGTSLRAD